MMTANRTVTFFPVLKLFMFFMVFFCEKQHSTPVIGITEMIHLIYLERLCIRLSKDPLS